MIPQIQIVPGRTKRWSVMFRRLQVGAGKTGELDPRSKGAKMIVIGYAEIRGAAPISRRRV